jgi:hypothetical protein
VGMKEKDFSLCRLLLSTTFQIVRVQCWVLNLHNYRKLWHHMLEMKEQHGMDRKEMTHMPAQGLLWRSGPVAKNPSKRAEAHCSLQASGR